MNTLLIIGIVILYLIGVVLSYGRMKAESYEIEKDRYENYPGIGPMKEDCVFFIFIIFSWYTFFIGVYDYFNSKEKYFFKWSKKELRIKWNNRNKL